MILVGVYGVFRENLRFQTKLREFPHSISDLTKIDVRFQDHSLKSSCGPENEHQF